MPQIILQRVPKTGPSQLLYPNSPHQAPVTDLPFAWPRFIGEKENHAKEYLCPLSKPASKSVCGPAGHSPGTTSQQHQGSPAVCLLSRPLHCCCGLCLLFVTKHSQPSKWVDKAPSLSCCPHALALFLSLLTGRGTLQPVSSKPVTSESLG
jgi:hypothetical protein